MIIITAIYGSIVLLIALISGISAASCAFVEPKEDMKRIWEEGERKDREAKARCRAILDRIEQLQRELPDCLSSSARSIGEAYVEYAERAYEVMFNRAESAYQNIQAFRRGLDEMGSLLRQYNQLLAGHRHTFPPVSPPPSELLDAARFVSMHLAKVVRLGETNPTCTSIWLQIKEIKVLRSGFASLADAFDSMGKEIVSSINSLESQVNDGLREFPTSTSAGISDAVAEQARTTRAVNFWGTASFIELERMRRAVGQ